MKSTYQDIAQIMIPPEEIDATVTRLAEQISNDYPLTPGKRTLLLCVLKGSIVFIADLMKKLTIPVELDCVMASSYRSGTVSGQLVFKLEPKRDDWQDVDVLLVEDIVDTGHTLTALKARIEELGAASVRIVTLLDKPSRRHTPLVADYIGRQIPDVFIVGYGLDYAEKYRDLPFIGILSEDAIAKG